MSDEDLGAKGEFRLLSKIGEGGMADVFLAERQGDDGFRTRVALKRLHQGLAMDSYFIRQLVREARLLGQLEHANIVRVFDLRRIGDEYFVVMEYVDGIDLAAAIKVHRQRKTKLPLPFFFHVALSLLEALSYAHTAVDSEENPTPLIHRDIKPSNVMLSRRGVVKLTDFGIAHVGDGSVTGGLVQGTANYMSPEQAYGEEHLTPASDIYSLGVVFFEMLCGRPLVSADNYLKAIQQVREQRVTSEDLERLGVKPGLRMVVARMLCHDKEGRYSDPDMVRNDLQFVADRLSVNLSWHRIRSYVGRLMGILGRAPSRATLSNLEVQDKNAPDLTSGSFAAESTLPPVGFDTAGDSPATPPPEPNPVHSAHTSTADVTSAVRKDLLESQLSQPGLANQETLPVAAAYGDDDSDQTETKPELDGSEQSDERSSEQSDERLPQGQDPPGGSSEDPSDVGSPELPGADWIEDDETAVYTGELPVGDPSSVSSTGESDGFGAFEENTDENTIPFVGEGPSPPSPVVDISDAVPPPEHLNVPQRQSGSFPPPPLSMTGEFRPNKLPPKPTPAVAFLPEATEAGPTGTQVLGGQEEPEDKTWVLSGSSPSAPAAQQRNAGHPQQTGQPSAVKAPVPPRRQKKRRRKRRKKKAARGFLGLDNRTVILAAIFAVVIGTLLFVILVVLLMRSQPSAEADEPALDRIAEKVGVDFEEAGLNFAADSGILASGMTLPPGYLLPITAGPEYYLEGITT